jgi:hypothetical protein
MGLRLFFVACVFDAPTETLRFEKVGRPNSRATAGAIFEPELAGNA